ncbi:hypothetical protein MJO28_006167, partial [Puccinia striiformis f. sp. tritici]
FGEDHLYFPECHSQSEWEFQFILSKTSSLNLLETINPLHFMPEEPFLTKSEDQDYISPYLIPSSPAFTKALEISTSQSLQEENHVQKDPGKNSEQMIKPNPTNQQDSSCDSIQLPTSKMDKSDLQFVKPTGRSLNGLTPLWNFLSGCLVLLLGLSGTVCSVVGGRAGLEGISVGSGEEKNQYDWLSKIFSSIAWKEELGLVPMMRIKDRRSTCSHRCEIIWRFYLFATLGWLALVFLLIFEKSQATIPIGTTFHTQVFNSGRLVVSQSSPSTVVRRHESHRQPSAPAVKSGRAEQSSLWTSRWKRVIDDDHKQQQRTPTKLINAIAATSSVPVRTPESEDINNDTCNNTIKALDLHPIVCSEQSIDHHHSCYRLHRSVQPWILQTSKKKQHQIQVDETGYILKDPFPFDSYSLIAYKESDRLPDEDINQFLLLFSHHKATFHIVKATSLNTYNHPD